jgi:hypothetical protein
MREMNGGHACSDQRQANQDEEAGRSLEKTTAETDLR